MSDSLFTVFCDYDGGTYISQHRVENPTQAIADWAGPNSFLIQKLKLSSERQIQLQNELFGDLPSPLDDLISVWCSSARVKEKLLILYVIKTTK